MRPRLVVAALWSAAAILLAGCFGEEPPSPPLLPEAASPDQCLSYLDRHKVSYRRAAMATPRDDGGCGIDNAVRVERLEVRLNRPATMSCTLASRIDQFEREMVEQLAVRDLGRHVAEIEQIGAYSCRGVVNGRHGNLSEHAFGRAIDIAGFRFSDGTSVSVVRDWSPPGPERRFLHDVAYNACRYFSVVLTPDTNRDHYNHFHLDIGPSRVCSVGT